jgi:hypothetical protein
MTTPPGDRICFWCGEGFAPRSRNAREITGNYRASNDLQGAVDDISKAAESYATLAGINTPARVLIKVAPFILVALLYLMFIQLGQLDRFWHNAGEPWLFRDVSGLVGRMVAYITALLPVLAVLWVFFAFADIQGQGVFVGGRLWMIRQIFGLERLRQLDRPGDYDWYLATAVLILFIPAVYLAGESARRFISLIRRYQRS